jgi:hypothetical protein
VLAVLTLHATGLGEVDEEYVYVFALGMTHFVSPLGGAQNAVSEANAF